MLADRAEVALTTAGFQCFRINGAQADDCTKMTSSHVVATCIQRVTLHYDADGVRLARAQTHPIVCASF